MDYIRFGPEIKTPEQLESALEIVDATVDVEKEFEDREPRILVHNWHRLGIINDCFQQLTIVSARRNDVEMSGITNMALKARFKGFLMETFKGNIRTETPDYAKQIMGTRTIQAQEVLRNMIVKMSRSTLPAEYTPYFNDYVSFWHMPGIFCEATHSGLTGHCQFKELTGLTLDDVMATMTFETLSKAGLVDEPIKSNKFLSQQEMQSLSIEKFRKGQNQSFFVNVSIKNRLYRQFFGPKQHMDYVLLQCNDLINQYSKTTRNTDPKDES